ncbi:MAG: DUF1805 domain-containing protein [Candidatus Omnitrophica bacterium]|nr:DUF1805 domain-containing protein [Candidatus Omnitrophota bacterium]
MSIKAITKSFPVSKGLVEGAKLEWESFSLLVLTAPKGFLACGIFDLDAIERFGLPCGIVESTPDNPIGTLERMVTRKVVKLNGKARALGIVEGESAISALGKMF